MMFPVSPSIAIVGSGAVGGYYGARLAQHGHDVHFLLRSDYSAVRERGWVIRSCDGDFSLPPQKVRAFNSPQAMPKVDLVVVTLKTTANDRFRDLIGPLLKGSTTILTLQNGLGNEEALAELFGADRVLGGLAFTCINRVGSGEIHHMDHGLIRMGEFGGGRSERLETISRIFNDSQINCQVLDDLRYGRWEKLVWNVPFNGLGAVMDLTTDQLLASEAGVSLVQELMAEVISIAKSIGVNLPSGIIDLKIQQTRTMGAYQTSMQIDRKRGRPLETEAIIGRPLQTARLQSILTPALTILYRQLMSLPYGQ
jgi:2-dehydropantoate 2-reductase